jgi:hypothetical protein
VQKTRTSVTHGCLFRVSKRGPIVYSVWSLSWKYVQESFRSASGSRRKQRTETDSTSGSVGTPRSSLHAHASTRKAGRRCLLAAVSAATAFSAVAFLGLSSAPASSGATPAPAVTQCNPPDFPTTAGFQVTCSVSVVNTTTSTGATSSTVTTSACLAAAGVPFPSCPLNSGPVVNTTISTQLVTSVNQCDGIVTDGGSNVYCNVTVTNNVPVGTANPGATVDQCIGSATGGGSTQACNPGGSTTSATVTQCNGSATGGGTYNGETTVACDVTGATSALPVTINQCNGTATGGGSAVTCMATMANNFVTPTTTTTTATAPASPTKAVGASGGSGSTGLTGSSPGAGGSTGPPSIVGAFGSVPSGGPQTGFGGASHSRDDNFLFAGALALVGAGLALTLAVFRRRALFPQGANEDS